MSTYQDRVSPWLEPIPGELPAGPDARYLPAHEAVRAQVAALDAPSGGDVDWAELVRRGEELLTSKSKDLLIACYTAHGLLRAEGLPGLASGLWLVAEVTDRYWDGCWPALKRVRARANAITWLTERTATALEEYQPGPDEHDTVAALGEAADRLVAVVRDRFDDPSPKTRPVVESIQRLELSLPARPDAPSADPEPAPSPVGEPAPSPVGEPAAPAAQAPPEPEAVPEQSPSQPDGDALVEGVDRDAQLATWAAPFVEPISEEAPAGQDARYEPEHEEVRAAIAQLGSPAGGAVDWAKVESSSAALLKGKTKDFLISTYLATALYEQRGLEGLAEGLAVLAGVLDGYWDNGFPPVKRLRARANAIDFLLSRVETMADWPLQASDREAVLALEAAAKRLAEVVRERFDEQAPSLRPLLENVQRLALSLPAETLKAPEPTPGQAPTAASAAPKPPPQAAARPGSMPMSDALPDLSAADDVVPFLKKVGASLHKAAKELYKADPASPTAYRLSRVGLYLHFEEPPPATDGRTSVPAPGSEQVSQLKALAAGSKWSALLEEAESALGRSRFWLDLHRYVAMALGGLGHEGARQAVVLGTAGLLGRMPELPDLQFADGQPFADPATRTWLGAEVSGTAAAGEAAASGEGAESADGEARALLAEADKLAATGKAREAVDLLEKMCQSGESASARFGARMAMARACVASGALAVADGIFSGLAAEIDIRRLEEWDPSLAASCYQAHYEALKQLAAQAGRGQPGDSAMAERRSNVYARLCRVSPSAALKVGE